MMNNNDRHIIPLPGFKRVQLTPQVQAIVVERHTLPSASIELVVTGGAAQDTSGKEGLGRLTANLLKKGSGKYSADQFSFAVEERGATIYVNSGYDSISISGEFLAKDVEFGLEMIASMLFEPRFADREINKLKKKEISQFASMADEPAKLCFMLHNSNLFKDHPYGRPLSWYPQSIRRLSKQDIQTTHKNRILNSRMLLTIVGDVSSAKILASAAKAFSGLKKDRFIRENSIKKPELSGLKFYLVNKPDHTQAHIRIGTIGIARRDPAFYKLLVANTLFGGSFTSRLMTEVRVNKGLTYGIGSNVTCLKNPGPVVISTFTKTGSVYEVVDTIFHEIRKFQSSKISKKDLTGIQKYLTGMYPFSLETNKRFAQSISILYFYGLTKNEIKKYSESIRCVSEDDIKIAAGEFYSNTDAVITILGNTDFFAAELEKRGTIIQQDMKLFSSENLSMNHGK